MCELPPVELSELKQKIITDEIKTFDNQNELKSLLVKLSFESNEAIDQFKDILLMLTEELGRVTGDHMLNMYKNDISKFISDNPKGIVDSFILKCYENNHGLLRAKIVKGDETFFMNNSLDDVSDGDSSVVNIIFKFKDFWGKLNADNKTIIKETLMALIAMCDIRYVNYKKTLCLKQLNSSYSSLFNNISL